MEGQARYVGGEGVQVVVGCCCTPSVYVGGAYEGRTRKPQSIMVPLANIDRERKKGRDKRAGITISSQSQ